MTQDTPSGTPQPRYISLFETAPAPCPYLPDRMEKKVFTLLPSGEGARLASLLTQNGFRRNQGMFYRQHCAGCAACIAVRLLVQEFAPNRQMRRVQKRAEGFDVCVEPATATPALYSLFKSYVSARHGAGGMAGMTFEEFRQMVEDFPETTRFLIARDKMGETIGAMLFDELDDGTSAVYSFFDTQDAHLSLGTFLILKLAEYTASTYRPHLYLGFWVKGSRTMEYKAKFQPLQVFTGQRWAPFNALEKPL